MNKIPIGVHGLLSQRSELDRPGVVRRITQGLGGTPYTREEFAWSEVQPDSPANFQWDKTDSWVRECALAGLHVFALLNKPPVWATGGPTISQSWTRPPVSEPATGHFADYCGAVAARYGPGGTFWTSNPSIPPVPVTEYEIWNEPYKSASWKNSAGEIMPANVAKYAAMVVAAAEAIHTTAGCSVFASVDTGTDNTGQLPAPQPFLIPFLQETGVRNAIDGLSVHPYGYNYAPATFETTGTPRASSDREWRRSWMHTSKLNDYRAILHDFDMQTLPVWITEIGYPTHIVSPGLTLGDTREKAEQQQAMRVEAVFRYLRSNFGLVQGLIFYTWQTMAWQADVPASPNYNASNPEHFFGLMHNDGIGGYGDGTTCTAKPAWEILKSLCVDGING